MKIQALQSAIVLGIAVVIGMALTPNTAEAQHPAAEAQHAPFEAVHIERERKILLNASPEEVFPLFEPKGRAHWSRGWNPQFLYPVSGDARPGAVLTQTHPAHEDAQVWVLADHDQAAKFLRYVIFIPPIEAFELEVRCGPTPHGETEATVIYRVTALSEHANEMVQDFFDNDFEKAIDGWATAINRYLEERMD